MNKTMKKVYETPFTSHVRVEMESQLCAGSATVKNPESTSGGIDAHDVNTEFDYTISGDAAWEKQKQKQ